MNPLFPRLGVAVIGAAWAVVAGCAAAPGYPPVKARLEAQFAGQQAAPLSMKQLVVLRFPFAADENDAAELRGRFNGGTYYGMPRPERGRKPDEDTLGAALAKTAYYAVRLHEALQAQLPDADVVLQPVSLRVRDGVVAFAAGEDPIAPAVVVDFFAYVWPKWQPGKSQPFATVGRTVVPIVTVRTLPQVSAQTSGAVSGMQMLAGAVRPGSGSGAFAGAGAGIVELLDHRGPQPFPRRSRILQDPAFLERGPWQPDRFLGWPTLRLTLDEEIVAGDRNEFAGTDFALGLSSVVRDVMGAVASHPAARAELAAFVADSYDAPAAAALRAGRTLDPRQRAWLDACAAAERTFLARQSDALRERLAGEWSISFREARAQEQRSLTKAKVVGWIGLVAGGLIGAPGVSLGVAEIFDSANSRWARRMNDALGDVRSVPLRISWQDADAESEIEARSLADLRAQLKERYDQGMPSPRS
jgi:hypothetical protein